MKKELLNLLREFVADVDKWNRHGKSPLDDRTELTFENFIKWLEFNHSEDT